MGKKILTMILINNEFLKLFSNRVIWLMFDKYCDEFDKFGALDTYGIRIDGLSGLSPVTEQQFKELPGRVDE